MQCNKTVVDVHRDWPGHACKDNSAKFISATWSASTFHEAKVGNWVKCVFPASECVHSATYVQTDRLVQTLKELHHSFRVHSRLRSTRQRAEEHHSATRADKGRLHPTPVIRLGSNYAVCLRALIHNEKPGARWPVLETLPDDTLTRSSCCEMWTRENEHETCTGLRSSSVHTWSRN